MVPSPPSWRTAAAVSRIASAATLAPPLIQFGPLDPVRPPHLHGGQHPFATPATNGHEVDAQVAGNLLGGQDFFHWRCLGI